MDPVRIALGVVGSFAIGSIPFGIVLGRARGIDIREHGSRNIGATNVWRVLGARMGLLCFALDLAKGLVPTLAAGSLLGVVGELRSPAPHQAAWLAIGLAAVLGHMFSPLAGFRGGKGVATGFGVVLGLFPWLTLPGLAAFAVWGAVFKARGYVSLASIAASITLMLTPPAVYPVAQALGLAGEPDGPGWLMGWPFWIAAVVLGGLVIVRHRANIARLRAGTELRVGARKRQDGASS